MEQTLIQLIRRLEPMSKLSNREAEELGALLPDGDSVLVGDVAKQHLSEPRPAYRALGAFLADLPSQVLLSLGILLYAGRQEEDAFDIIDEICRIADTREAAVATVQEKRPRMDYIEKGISSIGVERLPELLESVERKLAELGWSTDYPVLQEG